jgi:6-pyruvoyltetrahydropterin/6-carboxytetrahydropterin synthase
MTVEVRSAHLVQAGSQVDMVMDYGRISATVQPLLEEALDHYDLNVTTGLPNPTSEALARWIYDFLDPKLPGLSAITIEETCTSACRYTLEEPL